MWWPTRAVWLWRAATFIGTLALAKTQPLLAADSPGPSPSGEATPALPAEKNSSAAPLAAPAKSQAPDPEYETGLSLFKAGRFSDAVKILKNLSKDESQKGKADLLIGTMYFQKKKLSEAKDYFEKAGEATLSKETAYAYGATYLDSEEYSKALKGLRANLKLNGPNRPLTRHMVAVCFFKLSQFTRAERYFQATPAKSLPKAQRLERQKYLAEIRQKHDELLSSFIGEENESRTQNTVPADFGGPQVEDSWKSNSASPSWGIKWKPGAVLRQESTQNLNRAHGIDAADLVAHRVGIRAYADGDANDASFGSMEFGLGFAGYDVKTAHSRSFVLPGIDGDFLSEEKQEGSEENFFVNFHPLFNLELTPSLRGELGARYTVMLPNFKSATSWGQSEGFIKLRAEGKETDGGLEIALQQPFDQEEPTIANDVLLKADVNQHLGEINLRVNAQSWRTDNTAFTSFDNNRMNIVDSRFKYHVGFSSEAKFGASGEITLGDMTFRMSYDYTSRQSTKPLERLNPVDEVESVAKEANKRMFAISFPLWDTVSLTAAGGTQSLSGYVFRSRDEVTGDVVKEYRSDVKQSFSQLGMLVVLIDWIRIKVNYAIGHYKYDGIDINDPIFQDTNPRAIESSLMHIELSKSF